MPAAVAISSCGDLSIAVVNPSNLVSSYLTFYRYGIPAVMVNGQAGDYEVQSASCPNGVFSPIGTVNIGNGNVPAVFWDYNATNSAVFYRSRYLGLPEN
jgi:hypothetical protein